MHAICANLVTCEASDCHHPATITRRLDPQEPEAVETEHGTRYFEHEVTYMLLCEQCDERRAQA